MPYGLPAMTEESKVTKNIVRRPLCFVIGPIGKDGSVERKHSNLLLHAVIKQVLASTEFGYHVKRADEDADPGMIGDRVVTDIINADLVVADLTDLNPNAFYELGIRHSTEKPTIHVAKADTALPFDNIAHRTIFVDISDWQSIENARARLAESARAIKAPDYKVSNPITQANASFRMRQSEDPRDRVVAELRERLNSLEKRLPKTLIGSPVEEYDDIDDDKVEILFRLGDLAKRLKNEGASDEKIRREVLRAAAGEKLNVQNIKYSGGLFQVDIGGVGFRYTP
jgi:hypothetical protein